MPVPDFSPGEVLTAAAMDSIGLWRIGGGPLSGTSTNFANVFTSDFTDYRIVIDLIAFSANADLYWRLLTNTTPETTANYSWAYRGLKENGTSADASVAGIGYGFTGFTVNGAAPLILGALSCDIYGPAIPQRTFCNFQAVSYDNAFQSRNGMSHNNLTNAYNGIQFSTLAAPTMSGNVTIYGYRKT